MSEQDSRLARKRLVAVLGLPEAATDDDIREAGERLVALLRARLAAADPAETERWDALQDELAVLEQSVERFGRPSILALAPKGSEDRANRQRLAGALAGVALTLALLMAYAAGYRVVRLEGGGFAATLREPARLILSGSLPGATLRVLDPDREQIFAETEAEGAIVELPEGRYALEVSRPDCPDPWTRSVYFESGATLRFEPYVCVGEGRLVIRSNVSGDRLRIDGLDVGATGPEAHVLGVGDHEIAVSKTGYAPFEARVRIRPDEELVLRAELESERASQGRAASPLPFDAGTTSITPPATAAPEPFDLGALQKELAPPNGRAEASRVLEREGLGALPDGGTARWHERVSAEFLSRYDLDGSGRIDRVEESDAVTCPFWSEVERDFDRGGLGLSMARYYGFDGSEWHPGALGFTKGLRSAGYARMKECGLQE